MKKIFLAVKMASIFSLILMGALTVRIVSDTIAVSSPRQSGKLDYYFTFVCPLSWNNVAGGMMDASADFNVNTKLVGSADLDIEAQAKAILDAAAAEPDGIITVGMEDNELLTAAINEVVDEGIPVILMDSDLPKTKRVAYIGSNNVKLGEMVADELISFCGGSADVCLIVSNLTSVNQKERVQGFEKKIAAYPDISISGILDCNSEPLDVQKQYLEFAKNHPDITAVCCLEGRSAIAIGYVLKDYLYDKGQTPSVIAVDYSTMEGDFPQEDVYNSIVNQDRRYQGYLAVQILVDYLNGNPVGEFEYTDITVYHSGEFGQIRESEKVERYEWDIYEN